MAHKWLLKQFYKDSNISETYNTSKVKHLKHIPYHLWLWILKLVKPTTLLTDAFKILSERMRV